MLPIRYVLIQPVLVQHADTPFVWIPAKYTILSRNVIFIISRKLKHFVYSWLVDPADCSRQESYGLGICRFVHVSLPLSLSIFLFLPWYWPPFCRYHRPVLVRADVNACWVAVPDAGFI